MQLRMWTYDLAREQSPSLDTLRSLCSLTLESGYNAIGLYLEHRFAYPSTPWAHGKGAATPEMVKTLEREFPSLQIIPFVNLLGHFEGMLYTEHGKQFREAKLQGLQACPCNPDFVALCKEILGDILECFSSKLIHIGGDETQQLGQCDRCKARAAEWESSPGIDGKAELYGAHFGPLAEWVVEQGRRPGVWGDMFEPHPTAQRYLPKNTLIFDWQYFNGVTESSRIFREAGFDVVGCPALHTYNATWMHVEGSEKNVREVVDDVRELGLHGVCVTTWEQGLFGSYGPLLPALRASGDIMNGGEGSFLAAYEAESAAHGEWARLMGVELEKVGGSFAFGRIRSSLKCRLLLYSNPFLAWLHHADEYCGEVGDRALDIAARAIHVGPNATLRGIAEFLKLGIEFVRYAENARRHYAEGRPGEAINALAPARTLFDQLEAIATANHLNHGGSLADIERCRNAKEAVERAMRRIKQYGDGSLGYLPAFEVLTHPKFVPHDQASWWIINRWANE